MAGFLEQTLGLALHHAGNDEWVYVLPGGGKVEVFGAESPDNTYFTTGPVAGFLVDDLRTAVEELRGAGVSLLGEPVLPSNSGDVGWIHFRAPDGNVYELTQGQDLEPDA